MTDVKLRGNRVHRAEVHRSDFADTLQEALAQCQVSNPIELHLIFPQVKEAFLDNELRPSYPRQIRRF